MPKPDVSPSLANSLHHHSPGLGSSQVDTAIGSGGELHQNVPGKADHRDGTAHLTDHFGHRCRRTQALLDTANVAPDEGVVPVETFMKTGVTRHWAREPKVRDLA